MTDICFGDDTKYKHETVSREILHEYFSSLEGYIWRIWASNQVPVECESSALPIALNSLVVDIKILMHIADICYGNDTMFASSRMKIEHFTTSANPRSE